MSTVTQPTWGGDGITQAYSSIQLIKDRV